MKRFLPLLFLLLFASSAWAGRTVVQSDNFDDNTLGSGSVVWSQLNSINAVMGNTGGQVLSNHVPEAVVRADGTYTDDQYSKLPIIVLPIAGNYSAGVICRASADNGVTRDYYKFEFNGASPKLTSLILVNNGTPTTLQSSTAITWSASDTIEIECEGTALRGYKNGVLVLSDTNSTLTTGKPGISITNQISRGDNWEGGNVTATAVGFPSTAVLDNFNRGDVNPVNTNWTADILGNGVSAFKLVGNRIELAAADVDSSMYWDTSQFGPNSEAYVTVADNAIEAVVIYLRLSNIGAGTTNGYYLGANPTDGGWGFGIVTDGVSTELSTFTQAISNGDSVGLGIVASTLTAYYKPSGGSWQVMGTQIDSTYSGAGYIGLFGYSFAGTGALDDFGGGGATAITGGPKHQVTMQ